MAALLGTSGAFVLILFPLADRDGLGSWLEPLLDRGPVRGIPVEREEFLAGLGSLDGRGEAFLEDAAESMSFFGTERCWTGMGGLRAGVGVCDAAGAGDEDSSMSAGLESGFIDLSSIMSPYASRASKAAVCNKVVCSRNVVAVVTSA